MKREFNDEMGMDSMEIARLEMPDQRKIVEHVQFTILYYSDFTILHNTLINIMLIPSLGMQHEYVKNFKSAASVKPFIPKGMGETVNSVLKLKVLINRI